MKRLEVLGLAAQLTAPLVAQQHEADHDKKITGGGTLPAGWKGRHHNLNVHVEGFAVKTR